MKRLTLLSCVLSTLAACAATPPTPQAPVSRAAPSPAPQTPQTPACPEGATGLSLGTLAEHPSSELVRSRGTGVEAYRLESGVWLANAPILVNEDFDFATAMALGPVGSGLASGKRKKDNEQRAIELASLTLPSEAVAELERLRQCGMHRWGLLWGGAKPALLIVSERFDAQGKLIDNRVATHPADALSQVKTWLGPDGEARSASSSGDERDSPD